MSMQDFWEDWARKDSWASLYEGKPNLRTYNFIARRRAVAKILENEGQKERILDVGCGSGDYALLAHQHGAEYHGIDFAESMIREAKVVHAELDCRDNFLVASGMELPYRSDSFDVVVGIGYIEYFADPDITLREIRRVLRPGGLLVIQGYRWDYWGLFGKNVTQPIRKHVFRQKLIRDRMPESFVDMRYGKKDLDALVARHGFEYRDHVYNHFMLLPPFLRRRAVGLHVRASEWAGRRAPELLHGFAVNYIGKYRLES